MGTLYVVGTPIGNLNDLTPRAKEVLGAVALVAAEDTRTTRRLLSHLELRTPLVSYHAHSRPARRAEILERLSEADVALVSEAGVPGVSDPGAALVAEAHAAGHAVRTVPGPSAVSAALSVSGLPADQYTFLGFLPRRARDRRALLRTASDIEHTLVAFESPHRVRDALDDLVAVLGDRTVVVARELTKRFEEVWRGPLPEAARRWSEIEPRGEFTLVVAGAPTVAPEPWDDATARDRLRALQDEGFGPKEASRQLADEANRPARELYRLWDHDA